MLRLERIEARLNGFTLRADIEVPRGARLAVLGASGSGKSTLLNVIAGFVAPDAGRVWIDKRDATALPVPRRQVTMLFQDGNLFPHLTAFDNVALGLRPDLRLSSADHEAVAAALAQVGLDGQGGKRPADLSGGQRSRLALARLLLRDKPLALLDEPFAALDPGLRREMLALVADLCAARDLTLVMVTHDLRDAERLATDLCLLEDGDIVLKGELAPMLADLPPVLEPWA